MAPKNPNYRQPGLDFAPTNPLASNPNTKPYDPNILSALTEHIAEHGPVVNQPSFGEVDRPFTHHKSDEASIATDGVGRTLKDRLADRLRHRIETIHHVGETIEHPEKPRSAFSSDLAWAKQKTGWEGVYKREMDGPSTQYADDDFTNVHARMFRKSISGTQPNPLRPVTNAEKRAANKIIDMRNRRSVAMNKIDHLRHSYALEHDGQSLSLSERKQRRFAERSVARLKKKVARYTAKMQKLSDSKNMGGRLAKAGLAMIEGDARNYYATGDTPDSGWMPFNEEEQPTRVLTQEVSEDDHTDVEQHREQGRTVETYGDEGREADHLSREVYQAGLKYMARGISKDEGWNRMSPESFIKAMFAQGISQEESQQLYWEFQTMGLIAPVPEKGQGFRVLKSKRQLEAYYNELFGNNQPNN